MTRIDCLRSLSLSCLLVAAACGEAAPPPATPASMTPAPVPSPVPSPPPPPATTATTAAAAATTPVPAAAKPPPDAARIATATGGKPETADATVKVSFPRDDLPVAIDGWKMPPFMGLTSWAGFVAGEKAGAETMVMGDFVLFEDEINPAMSAALDNGLEVTALHNHFFFDKPRVYFMHIGGEGGLDQLGKGVKAILDAQHAVRKKAAQPATTSGSPALADQQDRRRQARCRARHQGAVEGRHVQGGLGTKDSGGVRVQRRQGDGGQHVGRVRGERR